MHLGSPLPPRKDRGEVAWSLVRSSQGKTFCSVGIQAEAQDTGWYHAHTEPLLLSPDQVKLVGATAHLVKFLPSPLLQAILFLLVLSSSGCSIQLWILSVVTVFTSLPLHFLVEILLKGGTDPPLGLACLLWSGSPGLYL